MTDPQYRVVADKDSTPELVSTHAAPGDRLVYDVIDADRWSLVRIERPVEGAEPSVQPPTREIDRDELILTVRDVSADHHGNGWLSLSGPEAARIADAVIARFPQPTPSAEPERTYMAADVQEAFERGCIRGEQDANERNWSRRQYEKMQASLPPAEPVSIAGTAPGTTFVEAVPWTVVDADAVHDQGAGLRYRGLGTFDPSTIREVTPPKGEDRG